jgi:hypothetical protein
MMIGPEMQNLLTDAGKVKLFIFRIFLAHLGIIYGGVKKVCKDRKKVGINLEYVIWIITRRKVGSKKHEARSTKHEARSTKHDARDYKLEDILIHMAIKRKN